MAAKTRIDPTASASQGGDGIDEIALYQRAEELAKAGYVVDTRPACEDYVIELANAPRCSTKSLFGVIRDLHEDLVELACGGDQNIEDKLDAAITELEKRAKTLDHLPGEEPIWRKRPAIGHH